MDAKKSVQVAFFSSFPLTIGGGLEQYYIDTAREMMRFHDDVEIAIVTPGGRLYRKVLYLLRAYHFKFLPKRSQPDGLTAQVRERLGGARYVQCASLKELRETLDRADVVYTKNEIMDLVLLRLAFGFGLPARTIVGCHTTIVNARDGVRKALRNALYEGAFYRWLVKGAKAFHVLNRHDEELVRAIGPGMIMERIPCPIRVADGFVPARSGGPLRIAFIGGATERKGCDIFLETMRILSEKPWFAETEIRAALLTENPSALLEATRAFAQAHPNFKLLGRVPHEEIGALYDWTDISVIPSRFETMNLVALETGARGKVAVASDIPGPQDIVIDGQTGYLLPLEPTAFAKKIEDLRELKNRSPEAFARLGDAALERVRTAFDPKTLHARLHDLILRVL